MFKLSTKPEEGFRALELLNFLEASPVLREVHIRIIANISLEDVTQRRVLTLPSVQTFSLVVKDGISGYNLAAHISCPSASLTVLAQKKRANNMIAGEDILIFPTIAPWNAIVRQYTTNPVEAVTLEIKPPQDFTMTSTLAFRSLDMTVIRLGLEVSGDINGENETQMTFEDIALEVFSQASRTVRDHPLLPDIKRLHIRCRAFFSDPVQLRSMANEVGRLFKSVGPLDELALHGCDLRPYLAPFLGLPEFEDMEQPITFPPIKELTISHPLMVDNEECMAAIVELTKSQHALGVPFERVTVRAEKFPVAMVEMLEPWVGEVDWP